MLKMLIVEDNANQLKNITNIVAMNFPEIRVYGISFDGESILNLIEKEEIDLILLDLKLNDMSGVDIIKYIDNKKIEKYNGSIIVFSGEFELIKQVIHSPSLFTYVIKSNGYEALLKQIELIIKSKNDENSIKLLNSKIDNELSLLKYDFSHNGTTYLKETIIEIYKRRESFDGNLVKNIYPIIAKKHNKKVNTIYCDIKYATNLMVYNCEEKILNDYLGNTYYTKPKVTDIIYLILCKIS